MTPAYSGFFLIAALRAQWLGAVFRPTPATKLAEWQHRRRIAAELRSIPPHLMRDVGLVDLAPADPGPGRTLDHNRVPQVTGGLW